LRWPLYELRNERAAHKPAPWTQGAGIGWAEPPVASAQPSSVAEAAQAPSDIDAAAPPSPALNDESLTERHC
jgi:hypothetical protein